MKNYLLDDEDDINVRKSRERGYRLFVRKKLYDCDMSINNFAKIVGVPRTTISNILDGVNGPNEYIITKTAEIFGYHVDELISILDNEYIPIIPSKYKKTKNNLRQKAVSTRFSGSDLDELEYLCEENNLKMSDVIRQCVHEKYIEMKKDN